MLYLTTNVDYVNQNGRFFPCYDKDKTILRKKQVNFYLRYFLSIERIFKSSEIVLRRDSTRRKPTRSIEQTNSKSARSAKRTRSNNIKTAFYRKDRKTLEKVCQCFLYSRVNGALTRPGLAAPVRRLLAASVFIPGKPRGRPTESRRNVTIWAICPPFFARRPEDSPADRTPLVVPRHSTTRKRKNTESRQNTREPNQPQAAPNRSRRTLQPEGGRKIGGAPLGMYTHP